MTDQIMHVLTTGSGPVALFTSKYRQTCFTKTFSRWSGDLDHQSDKTAWRFFWFMAWKSFVQHETWAVLFPVTARLILD
jgi:hypothetical protein